MFFVKVDNKETGSQYLIKALAQAINQKSRVVWLVSGGSNIEIAVKVRASLRGDKLKNLTIGLVDERYGKIGHQDSNYYKLQQAGFDFSEVNFEAILTDDNLSSEQIAQSYENRLGHLFEEDNIVIGQFGIGSDGHTAGILPNSKACKIDDRLVIAYKGPDFERITLSFRAIKMLSEAYVFAYGEDKRAALDALQQSDLPLVEQPAQIFRQSLLKSYIINNMIGDNT